MTAVTAAKPSFFRRLFDTLRTMGEAMDDSAFEYTFDRVQKLEQEVAKLRDEVHSSQIATVNSTGPTSALSQSATLDALNCPTGV